MADSKKSAVLTETEALAAVSVEAPVTSTPKLSVDREDYIPVIAKVALYTSDNRYMKKGDRFRIPESEFNERVHVRYTPVEVKGE